MKQWQIVNMYHDLKTNILLEPMFYYLRQEGYVFWSSWLSVCLSVGILTSDERICIKVLTEVCIWPRKNPLDFGDDPDYDPDPVSGFRSLIPAEVCRPCLTHCLACSVFREIRIYRLLDFCAVSWN